MSDPSIDKINSIIDKSCKYGHLAGLLKGMCESTKAFSDCAKHLIDSGQYTSAVKVLNTIDFIDKQARDADAQLCKLERPTRDG